MIERIENIIKTKRDTRQYRGLILENKLKCLLISDDTIEISSASLNVNTGHFNDTHPGLAHLCEHMLFMGSTKYPDVNIFKKFIEDNAGITNAYTTGQNTNFYLQLPKQFFSKALEIFAQFFITPLFDSNSIENEINIIEHEFKCQLSSDDWRLDQLDKSTCKPDNPYCKFGTGNSQTLNSIINLKEELINYFKNYYSANLMQLCLLSNESLDNLESYAIKLFQLIPNKNSPLLEFKTNPYNHTAEVFYVVPLSEKRELILTFNIPDHKAQYCTSGYISYLISNEGENSLINELKKKNLCNSLSSWTNNQAKGLKFYNICLDMTQQGESQINEILKSIFQYLKLVKLSKPNLDTFTEINKLRKIKFEFKQKEKSIDYVTQLSQVLGECDQMENCLIYKQYYTEFDSVLVEELFDYLKPNRMKLFIVSKSNCGKVTQTEQWYGTEYKKEKLLSYLIDDLENCDLNPFFSLPNRNIFIPNDLSLIKHKSTSQYPRMIYESNVAQIWYKEDSVFKLPKVYLKFELINSVVMNSLVNVNLINLFVMVLCDELIEYSHAAGLAGLLYLISSNDFGLSVFFSGFSDKMFILVEYVFKAIINIEISSDRFQSLKDIYKRNLTDIETAQPVDLCDYYLTLLLQTHKNAWSHLDLLKTINDCTLNDLKQFIDEFLNKNLFIKSLMYGNLTQKVKKIIIKSKFKNNLISINKKDALNYYDTIKTILNLNEQNEIEIKPEINIKKLDNNYVFCAKNSIHKINGIKIYYDCERDNILNELISHLTQEILFDKLRSKEQLGYLMTCSVYKINELTEGVYFNIQSDKCPIYLSQRVEYLIQSLKKKISEMKQTEFETHINIMKQIKSEEAKDMCSQSNIYWNQIKTPNKQVQFDKSNNLFQFETPKIMSII